MQLPLGEIAQDVRVTDLLGRVVIRGHDRSAAGTLDVSQLPRRLYLARGASGKMFTGKFEKE